MDEKPTKQKNIDESCEEGRAASQPGGVDGIIRFKDSYVLAKAQDAYELEFRRVYADLYPSEDVLQIAIEHYRQSFPPASDYYMFPEVGRDRDERMAYLRFHQDIKSALDLDNMPEYFGSYLFSDIKELIGDTPMDLVYLTPASANLSLSSLHDRNPSATIKKKCLCAILKNDIAVGNCSNTIWNGGTIYRDAVEDGLMEWNDCDFSISLDEPTYERPILVMSHLCDEGKMLGDYLNMLRSKDIGLLFTQRKPKIPVFSFIGKQHSEIHDFRYYLDKLSVI